ncbi:hypothetical protein PLICBS_005809 [Purpureocillium lilacinum]|uniref:uncharacterized protein n=1 Tax=Purpureocillium lilacinum TaxID=33203 RepID=UPI0020842E66|nr:hypothetical protein PLICBS_005809 [Purpureocillium lilacinum]
MEVQEAGTAVASDDVDVIGLHARNGISVLVVGSGIGGLSAARELWRIGCDVTVLERQPSEVLTGDSFTIGPSARRSLSRFPRLEREVDALSWDPVMHMRDLGGRLVRGPMERTDMLSARAKAAMPGGKLSRQSRPRLYVAMLEHLRRVGVPVEHGAEVREYFEDENCGRAGVVLGDGSRREADLVIAADGVHGRSWELVLGEEVPARPSGDAMFRVSYPFGGGLQDPVIDAEYPLLEGDRPQVNGYIGPDIQLFIARTHDEISWSLAHKDDGRARESWDHHPPVEKVLELLENHKELPEAVRRVIRATPEGTLVDYRIMWRDPQRTWTSPAGRVLQLGDAAHTFHPSSGNGGTQAVEDAVSIAKCLSIAGKGGVEWATRVSNLLRFERVSCLQAFGIYNQASKKKGGALGELGHWIIAHDPEAYAAEKYEEALSHLQHGTPFISTNTPPGMVYAPWSIDTLVDEHENGAVTVLGGDWS